MATNFISDELKAACSWHNIKPANMSPRHPETGLSFPYNPGSFNSLSEFQSLASILEADIKSYNMFSPSCNSCCGKRLRFISFTRYRRTKNYQNRPYSGQFRITCRNFAPRDKDARSLSGDDSDYLERQLSLGIKVCRRARAASSKCSSTKSSW